MRSDTNPGAPPIEARGVAKSFGAVRALAGLDLTLDAGEALGLLGPNGAGKSTALSLLMGLRPADAGRIRLFGHPAGSAPARRLMGATPQSAGFPEQLTPRELLDYAAARYGVGRATDDLAGAFGLDALMNRRMAGFSGGEVRRVALALAFVGDPRLVFLDEPTSGLDSEAQDRFHAFARSWVSAGGALILTSHHWPEIEAVCDRLVMIDRGETVLEGTLAAIRARMEVKLVRFGLPEGVQPPGWLRARRDGALWAAETDQSDALLRRLVAEGVAFENLVVEPLALKDIIARIRGKDRP